MRISRDIKPLAYLAEHAQEIVQAFLDGRAKQKMANLLLFVWELNATPLAKKIWL
jgi:hypothetical protein